MLHLNMVRRFLYECITVLIHKSCLVANVSFFFNSRKNILRKETAAAHFVGFWIDRYVHVSAAPEKFVLMNFAYVMKCPIVLSLNLRYCLLRGSFIHLLLDGPLRFLTNHLSRNNTSTINCCYIFSFIPPQAKSIPNKHHRIISWPKQPSIP